MNKYIESDIRDGLESIRIGLCNIMYSMLKEDIKVYKLKVPFECTLIPWILMNYDDNIQFIPKPHIIQFKVSGHKITVIQKRDYCVFYTDNSYKD